MLAPHRVQNIHTEEERFRNCGAFIYTGAGKIAWLRRKSRQIQMDFRNVCAINAHSRHLLFSDFVVERSPADTENTGGQFLIAADMREGHANKFVLDAMEGRSYLK